MQWAGTAREDRILPVNELYVDLWPASPLGAIAKALDALAREQELDLSIVFALRDPVFAGSPIAALGYHVLPSPATPTFDHAGAKDTSFADVLLTCRFARVHDLSRAVSAWDGLFEVVKPDVIVADTSPVVMPAARGRIPVMVTGSGFAVPPAGLGTFPPFGEDTPDEAIQGLMLEVANMVLKTRNAPPLDRLPRLLEGEARLAFSLPKLDPYAGTRTETPLRPAAAGNPSRSRPYLYCSRKWDRTSPLLAWLPANLIDQALRWQRIFPAPKLRRPTS